MVGRTRNPPSIGATLENQDLAGEQRGLLDLIDKLQFAQLDNVKLPQIVVVGDQSAGKSSVLEAITGTPFPRHADACTRFATEIRLRRAPESKLTIRIIPDPKTRNYAEQERLRRFGPSLDASTDFGTLMNQAVEQIAPKNIPGRFAAEDILVVEMTGPSQPLLTVVDLPGLVRNANKDQSLDDIKAINDLTDRYMKSPRTIILAVVGGNGDYVQAPVLTKAREFDPSGARTIGVLTKPDLTESVGLEAKFQRLVMNEDKFNNFDLGWYVLLNPGPRKPGEEWPSQEERTRAENEFFSKGRWSELPPSVCGVAALKEKLSVQLQRHIGRHMRSLQKEIQRAREECEAELKALGTGKDTVEEMKEELVQLCYDSEKLVSPAVHGNYANPPGSGRSFFPRSWDSAGTPPQNLRARTVEENKMFADKVRTQGQKLRFSDPQAGTTIGRGGGTLSKKDFARNEVEPFLRQNAGTEFPLDYNSRLVYKLFQRHSENWARLAQEHKNNLQIVVNEFLAEVVDCIWPRRMRESLRMEFLDPQMKQMMKKAQEQVDLLRTDLEFEVRPYDPEYEQRIKDWRAETLQTGPYTEAEEVLEKMLIYYELSAKTFINNVITQVIERHLLQGVHNIFSWINVNRMDERTILSIAAEDKATREKRMVLKAKKVAIEEAADSCAALAMRKELRTYARAELDDEESSDEGEADTTQNYANGSPSNIQRKPPPPGNPSHLRENGSPNRGSPNRLSASNNSTAHAYTSSNGRVDDHLAPVWDSDPSAHQYASAPVPRPPPRPEKIDVNGGGSFPPAPQGPAPQAPINNESMQSSYTPQQQQPGLHRSDSLKGNRNTESNGTPAYPVNYTPVSRDKHQRGIFGRRG